MIFLYSGTPGSGKSLHLAKDIYRFCSQRKPKLVICNFEVDLDKLKYPDRFRYIDNNDITPDLVMDLCKEFAAEYGLHENNVTLIIDESQILFNARAWNSEGRFDWVKFYTQHRKFGCNVILVSQFDEMIDKQIRALIEYEVIHRKVSNFGVFGFILKILTFGELFVAVEKWYALNQKTGSYWFKAHKKYYTLYDTFNTFDSFSEQPS